MIPLNWNSSGGTGVSGGGNSSNNNNATNTGNNRSSIANNTIMISNIPNNTIPNTIVPNTNIIPSNTTIISSNSNANNTNSNVNNTNYSSNGIANISINSITNPSINSSSITISSINSNSTNSITSNNSNNINNATAITNTNIRNDTNTAIEIDSLMKGSNAAVDDDEDDEDDDDTSNGTKRKRNRTDDTTNDESSKVQSIQATFYDKDAIDKIFTDPNTVIVFLRLFNMRKLQYKNGVDLTGLNPQKLGIVNVKSIHHISKVVETRGDYYRVRVCRTCSKYFTLIELGSYSDLESALLINDMYDLQQQKYDHLCLLDKIDTADYLEQMTAKRRGVAEEQSLFTILQQRMSKFQEKREKAKKSAIESEAVKQIVQSHPSELIVEHKLTFSKILDLNSLTYHVPYLLWMGCDFVPTNIAVTLPAYLASIVDRNFSKVFDPKIINTNDRNISGKPNAGCISRNLLFLIISSLLPGNVNECKEVFDHLYNIYPASYETSYEFMDGVKHSIGELTIADRFIFEQTDRPPESLCAEHFPRCLALFKKTFEVCASADYKLRLLSWDNAELADNEVFIQGIQSQIEIRVTVLLGILTKLDAVKANQTGLKLDVLNALLRKAVCATLYACLINSTVALISSKLTINFYKLKFALQLCNKFLPYLLKNVQNTVLLQDFFQRQSDLLVFVLIDTAIRGNASSNLLSHFGLEGSYNESHIVCDDSEDKKKLASTLACEMLKLSDKCLNDLHANGALETVNYLELSIRTYSSLFGTYVAFSFHNHNDFSDQLGFTFAQVIKSLSESLLKFEKYIKFCNCSILSTHTLISLNNLIENCYLCSQKYSETLHHSAVISTIAKKILVRAGTRFVLSQLLVNNINSRTSDKADDII